MLGLDGVVATQVAAGLAALPGQPVRIEFIAERADAAVTWTVDSTCQQFSEGRAFRPTLRACPPCTTARGYDKDGPIDGVPITGASVTFERIGKGVATPSFPASGTPREQGGLNDCPKRLSLH